VTQNYIAFQ